MKKFIFGAIAIAVVVGVVVYCSSDDDYQISDWTWKEEKPKLITWEKLDTFVFESEGFKVEYPSTFMGIPLRRRWISCMKLTMR